MVDIVTIAALKKSLIVNVWNKRNTQSNTQSSSRDINYLPSEPCLKFIVCTFRWLTIAELHYKLIETSPILF